MFRIDNPSAAATQPAPTAAGTPGFFTDGNPGGGVPATIVPAEWLNGVQEELISVLAAAGITPKKDMFNQVASAIVAIATSNQTSGLVGSCRNLSARQTTAAKTLTFTADEVVVATSVGGNHYAISGLNLTVNTANVGANGMDTGAAPATGFVAVYAIYNPATGSKALLAVNATTLAAPSVYGGANMPSGYTASALISVWPTVASGAFIIGAQKDRNWTGQQQTVLTTSSLVGTLTSLSIASMVPKNALSVDLQVLQDNTSNQGMLFNVASSADGNGVGIQAYGGFAGNGIGFYGFYKGIALVVPQTIYYSCNGLGAPSWTLQVTCYTI